MNERKVEVKRSGNNWTAIDADGNVYSSDDERFYVYLSDDKEEWQGHTEGWHICGAYVGRHEPSGPEAFFGDEDERTGAYRLTTEEETIQQAAAFWGCDPQRIEVIENPWR